MNYLQVLAKLVVGGILLIVYARVGGRSQIHPMSGTEVVSSIVVGALISGSLFDDSVPVWAMAAAVVIWCVAFVGMRWVKSRKIAAEKLIDGRPVQLVKDGQLIREGFDDINLTLRDFVTLLHQQEVPAIDLLREAWYETNGKLTVVEKGVPPYSTLLVERGQVHEENLSRIGKDAAWLARELEKRGLSLAETFGAEWYEGELRIYPE